MWSTKAKNSDGGDFDRPSPGAYPAVLVGLVDLGTHEHVFNGEKKKSRKIFLAWELTGENDSNGQPFVLGQDYTWSLHKKAKLRPVIEGWIGKSFAENEEFDIISLLGKACLLTVSEGTTSSGKSFSEIKGVGPLPRGMTAPPANHELFAFNIALLNSSLDDIPIPEWMPRNYGRLLKDDVKASEEFGILPPF